MEYKELGRSSLKVSRICLGTMNFGMATPEKDSFNIMDNAIEEGVNFFDTADIYGSKLFTKGMGTGLTEEIIGNWFNKGKKRREKIILATKVFFKMENQGINNIGLSAYRIKHSCEESLRRLKTDHIDIYYMHQIDVNTTWEEIWQTLEQLIREGKIIYVGCSNFAAWNMVMSQNIAESKNLMGLIADQECYNLSQRLIEMEVVPACKKLGIGILPFSPLAGGLLAGLPGKNEKGRRSWVNIAPKFNDKKIQLRKYEEFCKEIGFKPSEVALAWLLHNNAVTSVVTGVRTLNQFKGAINSLMIKLSKEDLDKLDKIWPGPKAEAPYVYRI